MSNLHALLILLFAIPALGHPFGFGLFQYDDDDDSDETPDTPSSGSSTGTSSACQMVDNVLAYFGEVYEALDQTFNPFYEPPPPPPPTTTMAPDNVTTTVPPAQG